MKYLVVANPRPIPIPKEQAVNLYKATAAWIEERLKNGRLDCNYIFLGGGGLAIANVNSQEEAFDELISYPLYGFFQWEVTPLIDWEHGLNTLIDMFTKMKG